MQVLGSLRSQPGPRDIGKLSFGRAKFLVEIIPPQFAYVSPLLPFYDPSLIGLINKTSSAFTIILKMFRFVSSLKKFSVLSLFLRHDLLSRNPRPFFPNSIDHPTFAVRMAARAMKPQF
ncbi:MAG: hypothetical protein NTX30_08800, partial [Deltaproteobacteria bacterium]|nr:hypothetical protein [Deltaproteobacteria bacterium]